MIKLNGNPLPIVLPKIHIGPGVPKRSASGLNVDIEVEKRRDTYGHQYFGRSTIQLSGAVTKTTFRTDKTIRIHLPDGSGVQTLNLIYDEEGQPKIPEYVRKEPIFNLLTQHKPELVQVEPVISKDASNVLVDINLGEFDVLATARESPVFETSSSQRLVTDIADHQRDEIQLLRIRRTGKFFTYNKRSGKLNKLKEKRKRFALSTTKSNASSYSYPLLPDDKDWKFNFDSSTNFYRKYLLKEEIDENIVKQEARRHIASLPERTHNPSLPERTRPTTYRLERAWSFTSDTTNVRTSKFYQRYLRGEFPLEGDVTDRRHRLRLTRSNVLRHEFRQSQLPVSPIPTLYEDDMEQSKQKVFDANNALQEDNLKCPVCRNYYDTRDRNPHILQCLHSCCNSCLNTRVRAEMVQCPTCTEVHEVPNNEIEMLPVDNARQHLVKFFKVRGRAQEIGCDSCDPRNRATHRCKECDEFLCGVCTEAHKRTKVTKVHNVVNVDTLKKAQLEDFHHKRTCPVPEHEDQHFSFYCYSKGCDMPICSLCAVNEHNKADGHDIRKINEVYVENKRLVENLLIDIKHKRNIADEAIQGIEEEIQNLYIKESSTEEDLDQSFLACQKQLEKRKNELKEKLVATSKAKKKGMESQLDKLISEKGSLDHAVRFSTDVLGYSDATEFLQIKEALFNRLGELKEMDIDSRPHNKADIKFHGHKMMEAFQKFSNKMGEVWSTTAFIPNTKIQTYDIGLGREETAMMITLHDYERRPLAEPGVDIRVDVTNPIGKKSRAHVIDLTDSEGAYKVIYQGTKLGDHRASVFVLGIPVIDPGVMFKVRRPGALEEDVIKDYEPAGQMSTVRSKIDTGTYDERAVRILVRQRVIRRLIWVHTVRTRSAIVALGLRFDDDEEDTDRGRGRNKTFRVFGDIISPDFTFDGSTCHPQNMVTSDSRTLKNIRGRTANIGTALKNYRGAIGTKSFSKPGKYYFEVVVYFFIKRQLRNDLIFEVALSRKSEIDKNYTVDGSPYAWTICARRCPLCRTVCLMAFHNGVRVNNYHNPLTENAPPGTTLRTTIGFLVDIKNRQWFIVDAKNRRLYFRFRGIDTTKPLWPVFGAYSSEYVSVSLALKTGKDVQAVPDIPDDV